MVNAEGSNGSVSDWDRRMAAAANALRVGMENQAKERIDALDQPDWRYATEFFGSLRFETDRAIPLLSFSFIDTEVRRLLEAVLNPSVKGGFDQLFGPHGPLGSASARINLAHSLTWITKTTAQDLLLLKNLRNESAHEPHSPESMRELLRSRIVNHKLLRAFTSAYFEDLDVDWSKGLPSSVEYEPQPGGPVVTVYFSPRNQAIVASALTAWVVMQELHVAPLAIRTGVHPGALMDSKSKSAPLAVAEARERLGEFYGDALLWAVCRSPNMVLPFGSTVVAETEGESRIAPSLDSK